MLDSRKWSEHAQILGIPEDAGFSEIQCAYRRLVLSCHPDVNKSKNASRDFRRIVDAYTALIGMLKEENVLSGRDILARMEADPTMEQLSEHELEARFRYSSSSSVRASAILALGLRDADPDRKLLKEALEDREEQVRVAALRSLERTGRLRHLIWVLVPPSFLAARMTRGYARRVIRSILARTALVSTAAGFLRSVRAGVFAGGQDSGERVGAGGVRSR